MLAFIWFEGPMFAPRLSFYFLHSGSCWAHTIYSIPEIDQFCALAVQLSSITNCASQWSKGSRNSVNNWSNLNSEFKRIELYTKLQYIYSRNATYSRDNTLLQLIQTQRFILWRFGANILVSLDLTSIFQLNNERYWTSLCDDMCRNQCVSY